MSQPQFRPFEGPRASRAPRRKGGEGEDVREFHRARIPMGSRGRFLDYVPIRAFDRNLYGKVVDGAFGIKEVRESRTHGTYGCVFISFSLSRCARLLQVHVLPTFSPRIHELPNIYPNPSSSFFL